MSDHPPTEEDCGEIVHASLRRDRPRMSADTKLPAVTVGDKVRFHPDATTRWWTVQATNERFAIATRKGQNGTPIYTVLDRTGWTSCYNGVDPGPARSSLNTIGGGYHLLPDTRAACERMLSELADGEWEISPRRVVRVDRIELKQ